MRERLVDRVRRSCRVTLERRLVLMALAGALPASIVSLVLLWTGEYTAKVQWTLTVLIVTFWFGFSFALRERVVRPLQTISNLLAALREDDFSLRARGAQFDDALGELMYEVNALVDTLRHQRLGAVEATALLRKVMEEIDVAVFAFDEQRRLQLVNRAGGRLLAQASERLLGRSAAELGLAACLDEEAPRVLSATFPGGAGRWEIRHTTFRQGGLPHRLLVLTDVSQPLREEERQAWQRLIRVLSHELNNSLTPIKSIAGSLEHLLTRDTLPDDWRDDMRGGLAVIASRSGGLARFLDGYARLAKLPPPQLVPLDVQSFVRRVAGLETRLPIAVLGGPDLTVRADGDQLEQLLINLLRNAVDAALETGGGVRVGWSRVNGAPAYVDLWVDDDGPGLPKTSNLFVPFFTTKPGGTGIGLVVSRQIAEAHGGTLELQTRRDGSGCRARLRLPA